MILSIFPYQCFEQLCFNPLAVNESLGLKVVKGFNQVRAKVIPAVKFVLNCLLSPHSAVRQKEHTELRIVNYAFKQRFNYIFQLNCTILATMVRYHVCNYQRELPFLHLPQ